jgi:hypothetical protein
MERFDDDNLEESFARFERAAAKGHEESICILSVLKEVELEDRDALKEAFAKTEEPMGWWFAGYLSDGREEFDFYKKSAEGGCSWGQVGYGRYFKLGIYVEQDAKVYVEWLEKAANQHNPWVMGVLGDWFGEEEEGNHKEKAVSYYRAGAEMGWETSINCLAKMLREGEGCAKDWSQAAIWSAKGGSYFFWRMLEEARRALESGATEILDCDFNQLCYLLGWGLFWYQYDIEKWNERSNESMAFGNRCLDYYCSCVELQQKSIFAFLLCWNQTTGGVKGPGQIIAEMVWEKREENMVKRFEELGREGSVNKTEFG